MQASFSDAGANSARRNEMESFLPKEIFQLIFSYVENEDLDILFKLPEFQGIYEDNYFWNILIAANFPKYYVPEVSGYNWRNIYYGLNLLFNSNSGKLIDILKPDEKIETLILRNVPNIWWTYLNYNSDIDLHIIKMLEDNNYSLFMGNLHGYIRYLLHKLITYINMNYPETFVYLIKNDLITGNKEITDLFITDLILRFDNVKLISKLITEDEHIFNELIKNSSLGPNIFTYLLNKQFPNTTLQDYLDIIMYYEIHICLINFIYDKIINENLNNKLYDYFKFMIDDNIRPN
jgi:hypothetical protein